MSWFSYFSLSETVMDHIPFPPRSGGGGFPVACHPSIMILLYYIYIIDKDTRRTIDPDYTKNATANRPRPTVFQRSIKSRARCSVSAITDYCRDHCSRRSRPWPRLVRMQFARPFPFLRFFLVLHCRVRRPATRKI